MVAGLKIDVACSNAYIDELARSYQEIRARWDKSDFVAVEEFIELNLLVDTEKAECSSKEDEERIRDEIIKHIGFRELDEVVFEKRKDLMKLIALSSGNRLLHRLGTQLEAAIGTLLSSEQSV